MHFSCDDVLLGGNFIVFPESDGIWFYESRPDSFTIKVEGNPTQMRSGKCYIKNGDIVSAIQSFSELGGDYFNLWWDQQRPLDLEQKIEIYLFDY